MTEIKRLEEMLEKVEHQIWVLELADRLVGEEYEQWLEKCAERNRLVREIRKLKGE
jgi:hypothetical protein